MRQHSRPFRWHLGSGFLRALVLGFVRLRSSGPAEVPISATRRFSAAGTPPSECAGRQEPFHDDLLRRKCAVPFWNQWLTLDHGRLGVRLCVPPQFPETLRRWSPPVPTTSRRRRDHVEKMPAPVKRPSTRQVGISTNSRAKPEIHRGLKIRTLAPTMSMKGDFVIAFFRQLTMS